MVKGTYIDGFLIVGDQVIQSVKVSFPFSE